MLSSKNRVRFWGVWGGELWKNIMRGWGKFSSHIRFEVRDGSNVRFWHDLRFGDMALKEAFPDLFGIACVNDTFVADNVKIHEGSIKWNVSFTRAAHDWDVDVFALFF
jgi:hypothetical protein